MMMMEDYDSDVGVAEDVIYSGRHAAAVATAAAFSSSGQRQISFVANFPPRIDCLSKISTTQGIASPA